MSTLDECLKAAMNEVASLNADGIQIRGTKRYTTVAKRMEVFRKHFGTRGRIRTKPVSITDEAVVWHAAVDLRDESGWFEQADGHAEEKRDASQINRTSAVENCETSAIGRALAALGLHGGEYASANEVENAIHQQQNPTVRAKSASSSDGRIKADAERFLKAYEVGIDEAVWEVHRDLLADQERYTAAWHMIPSDTRKAIKKVIERARTAA